MFIPLLAGRAEYRRPGCLQS